MKPIRMLAAILALLLLPAAALAEEYAVPEAKKGREAFLHDGNEKTYLTAYSPEGFTLSDLSAETRGVMLAWFTVPDRCEAQLLDETGKVVLTRTLTGGSLHQYLPTDGAAGVRLTGSKLELAEFCAVTDPDALPFTANDTPCDALLLLTHVGDESLAAAPALKVLTDHGLTVQIVYLYEEQRTPQRLVAEGWITDKDAVNKKNTRLFPGSGKFRRKTIDRKDFLFNKFESLLNEN